MSKGIIFDIQKFSLQDGPGIRTTVFFKGCPLRCLWCHNPESWKSTPELLFDVRKCSLCRQCLKQCPVQCHHFINDQHIINRNKCIGCGNCVDNCYSDALELCGKKMSVDSVLKKVLEDKSFYKYSGGGITLSGGEPMAQFDFSLELLQRAHAAQLHTAMETCGFAEPEKYAEIAPYVNLFLFDIKSVDPQNHLRITGQPLMLIHENLQLLVRHSAEIILRCPLVLDWNDSPEELAGIGKLANSIPQISEIQLEPYHTLGAAKSARLGIKEFFSADVATPEQEQLWRQQISQYCNIPIQVL